MHIVSLRAKAAALGGIAILAIGLLPLATGVFAASTEVTPITGGTGIQSNTARVGGSGAWTPLHGPTIREASIGAWVVGEKISLALPANFEWNATRTTAPGVASCDKISSRIAYSSSNTVATITIQQRTGPVQGSTCTVSFNNLLMVRPVANSMAAGSGGTVALTFVNPHTPTPGVFPGGAGRVSMVQSPAPTPTPTPTPAGAPIAVTAAATGGSSIPSSTARVGGSGAFTQLTGPSFMETSIGALTVGTALRLTLPANFEWNTARTSAPAVTSCDKLASGVTYPSASVASITILQNTGAVQGSTCRIDFGSILQVRPIDASVASSSGNITSTVTGTAFAAAAGFLSMTAGAPTGPLSLAITAPTMNNMAINWGEGINITTTGTPATVYQVQITTTDPSSGTPVWETLTDSSAVVRNFTIGSSGTSTVTPPYTPIRNYWYRSISGANLSNIVRVTVRQTISIRPQNTSTRTISRGTTTTFTATARPARPELTPAVVRFELFVRSGSSWVLSQTINRTIDSNGVATWAWTASQSGSFYVRAQAQPTPVNANSFWTPNQFYNVN